MKSSGTLINSFAIAVGVFLMAEGVWGLFTDTIFGYLTTNILHAVIHLVIGTIGLILGIRQTAQGYCIILGLIFLATGILFFLPAAGKHIAHLFNMNVPMANTNLFLGITALLVALSAGPSETARGETRRGTKTKRR